MTQKKAFNAFTPQKDFEISKEEPEFALLKASYPEAYTFESAEKKHYKEHPYVVSALYTFGVTVYDLMNRLSDFIMPQQDGFSKFDPVQIFVSVRDQKAQSPFLFDLREALPSGFVGCRNAVSDVNSETFKFALWSLVRNHFLLRLYRSLTSSFFDYTSFVQMNQAQNIVQITIQFDGRVPSGHFDMDQDNKSRLVPCGNFTRFFQKFTQQLKLECLVLNDRDASLPVYALRSVTALCPDLLSGASQAPQTQEAETVKGSDRGSDKGGANVKTETYGEE